MSMTCVVKSLTERTLNFLQMRMTGGGRVVQCQVLLLVHFLTLTGSDFVGQSVGGEVGEGNYTYYTLKQTGDVRLELISIEAVSYTHLTLPTTPYV